MLGLQVIQELTTILLIIRLLPEVTKVQLITAKQLEVTSIRLLHHQTRETIHQTLIKTILLTLLTFIAPLLQPQHLYIINRTTNSGQAITVKQKSHVPRARKSCLPLVHLVRAFQLPVVLSILAKVGLVNTKQLRDMRRYAIVALVALAAVITPPDAISMISLAVPLIALYEISIVCVWFIQKGKAKADAQRQAEAESA